MKTYNGNYLGIVIDNNDPEFRGRVQVFVPHIMPTLYENWNKKGDNIRINCVGDNVPQGLSSEIIEKLKLILPWAEAASPIVGQSAPGSVSSAIAGAISLIGGATAGAITTIGNAVGGAVTGGAAAPLAGSPQGLHLDQSPTAVPTGTLPPGTSLKIPTAGSHVDVRGLKPLFTQRLNGFYQEAQSLGYKISCTSAYRSSEYQANLYAKIGSPGAARPGNSAHEFGIAVDLYVTGPGVSITQINVAASRSGKNYDTPQFRELLKKYGLHQPLHPINRPSGPEHWHIEPTETPPAGGTRGRETNIRVAAVMSQPSQNNVAETTSSSQFAANSNPLQTKNPSNTASIGAAAPSSPS